jgi:hypothetical protein
MVSASEGALLLTEKVKNLELLQERYSKPEIAPDVPHYLRHRFQRLTEACDIS